VHFTREEQREMNARCSIEYLVQYARENSLYGTLICDMEVGDLVDLDGDQIDYIKTHRKIYSYSKIEYDDKRDWGTCTGLCIKSGTEISFGTGYAGLFGMFPPGLDSITTSCDLARKYHGSARELLNMLDIDPDDADDFYTKLANDIMNGLL